MAIATTSAHVSRALDFYNKEGLYFSIGRTTPWENETNPPTPELSAFKLDELVGLKRVDAKHIVIQDEENGTIYYRDTKWRIVTPEIITTTASIVAEGDSSVVLTSLYGIKVGEKLRIDNEYEGKIMSINTSNNTAVLDVSAPRAIVAGAQVLAGAYVEGARHVYLECSLNYDQFPIVTYRQIGLQTAVLPNTTDIIKAAKYSVSGVDEFTSLGNLEILDNRAPTVREPDQRETISIIVEL